MGYNDRESLNEQLRRRYEHSLVRYGFGLGVVFMAILDLTIRVVF